MINQDAKLTDYYNNLKNQGLSITTDNFNTICNLIIKGCNESMTFLESVDNDWPKFNFSNDSGTLGYSIKDDAICISLNHLNQVNSRSIQLEYKDQLIFFIPDMFYTIIKYTNWLELLGRESTIHRYQKKGNSKLNAKFPSGPIENISTRSLLLSDIEVEARKISDEISLQSGSNPVWRKIDEYLSGNFSDYYNKPIEEITKLPAPSLQASYEMEYYSLA